MTYKSFLFLSSVMIWTGPLNAAVVDDQIHGAGGGSKIAPTKNLSSKNIHESNAAEERMDILRCVYDRTKESEIAQDKYESAKNARLDSENILKTQIKKTGLGNVPLDGLDDFFNQDSFLKRVSQDDVETYGNFSAAIYNVGDDDQKQKNTKASEASTKIDREINDIYDQIDVLKKRQKDITKRSKTTKNVLDFLRVERKNLGALGVSFSDNDAVTFDVITQRIREKTTALQTRSDELNRQSKMEKTQYLNSAKNLFDTNLKGKDYDVAGVFHRNNGEFSGAALYEKDKNKLVLSFAGSKSTLDWVKNLFGWNQKLSSKHGLLQNISFHSGFGSHLDDNAESFFAFMRTWLSDFKKQHPGETLELVGVGHSLGGALSEIFTAAAKQIAESMDIPVKVGVMTFGAPNIVNKESLENYNEIMGGGMNIMRFEQGFDPVPKAVFWKTSSGASIQKDVSLFKDVNGTMMLPINLNPHKAEEYYHSASKVYGLWLNDFKSAESAHKQYVINRNAELEIINTVKTGIIKNNQNAQKNSANLFNMIVGFDKSHEKELKYGAFDFQIQKETEKLKELKDELKELKDELKDQARSFKSFEFMTFQEKDDAIQLLNNINAQIASQEDFLEFLNKYGDLTIKKQDESELDQKLQLLMGFIPSDIKTCLKN